MQSWQYLRLNIDDYLLKDGAEPMSGPLDMSFNKITNVGTGTSPDDAVNKEQVDASFNLKADTTYVDTQDALRLKRDGTDVMTGSLNMNNNQITNLTAGTQNTDAVNKSQVDVSFNLKVNKSGDIMTGNLDMGSNIITCLTNPTNSNTLTRKGYVDTVVNDLSAVKVNIAGGTMTGTLNLQQATNSRNIVIVPKDETYDVSGGGGFQTRNNYIRFNYGSQWCISAQTDAGADNGDNLFFRNGSEGNDNTKFIIGNSYLYSASNVGIGTTTPSEKLDVNGNTRITGNLTLNDLGVNGGATITSNLNVSGSCSSNTQLLVNNTISSNRDRLFIYDNVNGYLYYNEEGVLGSNLISALSRWSINNDGNAIFNRLDVSGGRMRISEPIGTSPTKTTGSLIIEHQNPGGVSSIVFPSKASGDLGDYGYIEYRDNSGNPSNNENGALIIGIENDTSGSNEDKIYFKLTGQDRMTIRGNGNVGIGTISPSYKLDISGDINITGRLLINGNSGTSGQVLVSNGSAAPSWQNV